MVLKLSIEKLTNNLSDEDLLLFTKLFSEFDRASLSLKSQYEDLQEKVSELISELEEKNVYLDEVYKKQQNTNKLLLEILSQLSSGVVVYNEKLKIVIFNNKAKEITKFSDENEEDDGINKISTDINNLSFNDIFKVENGQELNILQRQQNGEYIIEEEFEFLNFQGNLIPIIIKTSVLYDDKGEVEGFVHVFDDLTKIKKLEEETRKNKNLTELGILTAGIAHEIRNPLGGISGYATMLARDLKDDKDKLFLVENIQSGVKALNRITTEVLQFNKKIELRILSLSITDIIKSSVNLIKAELSVRNESDRTKIEIIEDYASTDISVDIDMQIIHRVLINLLRNAVQAIGKEQENLSVTAKLRFDIMNNSYTIEINDNGCGISSENLTKLFTPFHTTKASGTGLGLALVKRMIEALNGEISVKSELNKGTSFILKLPIKTKPT